MKARAILALLAVALLATTANADLRAYWAFEETSGEIAYDSSGNENHGLLYADTWAGWDEVNEVPLETLTGTTIPDRISGAVGGALQFCAGTDNYNSVVVAKDDTIANLGSTWTIAMWLRQDSRDVTPGGGGGYPRVISCPNYEIELGVPSWEYDYMWPYGGGNLQTDIGTSYIGFGGGLGQWYHMAVTYDGTDMKKYLNGQLADTHNAPSETFTDLWNQEGSGWEEALFKLGTQTWPNKDWFVGAMDEVVIFGDEYLSAGCVLDLYNGNYELPTPIVPEPGAVALLLGALTGCLLIRRR